MKFIFALSLMLFSATTFAQDLEILGVRTIGIVRIGPNSARHAVSVRKCADDLTHVKLIVRESGVAVEGAGVTYTDGTMDEYTFYKAFPKGYVSDWLNLDPFRSAGRCINSVFVQAHSTDARAARVEILGNFK